MEASCYLKGGVRGLAPASSEASRRVRGGFGGGDAGGRVPGRGYGGGPRGGGLQVLVLVLASTRPVVSGASLSLHTQPKAWECGVYPRYLSRSPPRIIFVSARAACRVPGPLVLRTARSSILAGSST